MRKIFNHTVLCVLLAFSNSVFSADLEGRQKYQEAFHENTIRVLSSMTAEDTTIEAQANKFTSCHMGALDYYSPELQKAAFDIILEGGSYADAKMAFDTALAAESSAGGEKFEKIQQMYLGAATFGKQCLGMNQ